MSLKRSKRRPKFYLDECVPDWVLVYLWSLGYNAHLSKDDIGPSTDDALLIRQCRRQGRVFVTLDKDIGRYVESTRHPGIIVIRGKGITEDDVCYWLGMLLKVRPKAKDFKGLYVEVGPSEVSVLYADGSKEIWRADGTATLVDKNGTETNKLW